MNQIDNNALISIIIPVYNTQDYILNALESVNNQIYGNYEAIVINDGSTDHSETLILDYIQDKPKFHYFYQENKGLSGARNSGLKHIKGDYVCFLDSDDMISPHFLEYMYKAICETNSEMANCYTCKNSPEFSENQNYTFESIKHADMIRAYLKNEKICQESVCNKMYRSSLFDTIHFAEGKIHEDTFIQYKLLEKIKGYVFVHFDGYNVTERINSITRETVYSTRHYDKVEATKEIFEYYKNTEFNKLAFNKYFGTLLYFTLKTKKNNPEIKKQCFSLLKKECKENGKLLDSRFLPFYVLIKLNLFCLLPNM